MKTKNPTALAIKHYYQNTRLTFVEIAERVGLKTPQAVSWYITYYKIKKPVREYIKK